MRIALDAAVGGLWRETVAAPAVRNLSPEALARAVDAAEQMLSGGPEAARVLNAQSLAWRRAARANTDEGPPR